MKVKFFGTRGSIPVCTREVTEFGGNTFCIQISFPGEDTIVICDAGSGIRQLGKELKLREKIEKKKFTEFLIGFTHFHWDHIQGFPFFEPAYDPSRNISMVAMGKDIGIKSLRNIFEIQMRKEFFPVPLEKMGASFNFIQTQSDSGIFAGAKVTACLHNHPGGAYSFRLEKNGKSLVICTDIEHGDKIDERIIELAKNADMLVHDAQYTPEELKSKKGWGHSSWRQAVEVAEKAGVKKLAMTHHDPDHNDYFLSKMEEECMKVMANSFLAREGMEIIL